MSDQFTAIEFADNPEPRCPVVLLIDKSGSMGGEPINQVNEGLRVLADELKSDNLASLRVELAIVTFGGDVRVYDKFTTTEVNGASSDANMAFVSAIDFNPPILIPSGQTPMGEAVEVGLRLIRERKDSYKNNGIRYYRPWLFLMTDGEPTDSERWPKAAEQVIQEEARKGVICFCVGTDNARMDILAKFSSINPPVKMNGLHFKEMFQWLSGSLSGIAQNKPGDQVSLPTQTWGTIDTSSI